MTDTAWRRCYMYSLLKGIYFGTYPFKDMHKA